MRNEGCRYSIFFVPCVINDILTIDLVFVLILFIPMTSDAVKGDIFDLFESQRFNYSLLSLAEFAIYFY